MVNVAPLAPTLTSPPNNSYIIVSEPNVFTWTFNDPGDVQSFAYFRFKKAGDADWTTYDTLAGAEGTYTLPADTWVEPFVYEWQAMTLDALGQPSPYSASRFINTIAVAPTPTITAPAPAAVIAATPFAVTWTIPAGFTQDAYRVRAVSPTGTVFYDSGVIEDVAARSALVSLPVGSGSVDLDVTFRYDDHWSGEPAGITVTNGILPPETPLIVCEQVEGMRPEVTVSITNPPGDDVTTLDTVSVDITRDGVRIAAGLSLNAEFTDKLVGAGTVGYRAIARTANGGTAESF